MGDSWGLSEPLTLSAWGSGVSDGSIEPAVLGAYADGQDPATTARPSVAGAGVGPVLYCADCVGFVVDGIEVSGGEQGILFSYSTASAGWGGVTVANSFIHDIRGVRSGGNPMAWGSGIGFNTTARTGAWGRGGFSQVQDPVAVFLVCVRRRVCVERNHHWKHFQRVRCCVPELYHCASEAFLACLCILELQGCTERNGHGQCLWPNGGPGGGYVNLDPMASLGQATFLITSLIIRLSLASHATLLLLETRF